MAILQFNKNPGISFKIKSNIEDLPVFFHAINEKAIRQTVARSIQRTTTGVKKATFEEIRNQALMDTKTMTQRKIMDRKYISGVTNASKAMSIHDMYGIINISDKNPSMIFFFAERVPFGRNERTNAIQYFVKAKVMGRNVGLGRAFMAFPNTNRAVVLAREGKGRYPVKKLFGPSIAFMIQRNGSLERIQAEAQARFDREMTTNFEYFLSKI